MDQIERVLGVVNEIGSIGSDYSASDTMDIYSKFGYIDSSGHPSQGKFIQEFINILGSSGSIRNKLISKLDYKLLKAFIDRVSAAKKQHTIIDLLKTTEDTTSANVAAYPVPIGMMRSKRHKDESVKDICAYDVEPSVIDEDLNETIK